MLKVIIVDDEAIVRFTLQTILDWEKIGYKIVGAFANGKQVLRYIEEEQQVDLIITDMNMPIMNGLELIEAIKKRGVATEILVISAYDDYELVRKAFKLGVNDYILKSEINQDSMNVLLVKIASRFKKNSVIHGYESPDFDLELWLETMLQEVEVDALDKAVSESVILENYVICLIMVEDYMRIVERFGQNLQESLVIPLIETVKQVLAESRHYFLISRGPDEYVLIFNKLDNHFESRSMDDELRPLLDRIGLQLKSFLNISVNISVSSFEKDQRHFKSLFDEVCVYRALRFPFGRGGILFPSFMKPLKAVADEFSNVQGRTLLGMMLDGDHLGVDVYLEDIAHKANDRSSESGDIKNAINIYLILICEVGQYLSDIQDDLLNVFRKDMNYYNRLLRFEQSKEMDIFIKNWIYWLMDYFSYQKNRTESNVIEKAKKYICNHYKNASFSFKELSQFLGISEKYFSAIFAKEEGETFTCYLTRIRIEHAKKLMITTNMKIYEICEEIGYNNVEHFSRVFKKSTGYSPREYRIG